MKKMRTITELYRDDPERADALVFGRRVGATRRGFLGGAGLVGVTAAVGGAIPFAASIPGGLVPAAMAQTAESAAGEPPAFTFPGKDAGLTLLGDEPLVAETPAHLLDDDTTPVEKFFIRNNGHPPADTAEPDAWAIRIDGLVNSPLEVSLGELKERFEPVTLRMVLECGGNGRSFFNPPARGNQWTNGGAGCAEWTGARLRDVLQAAGVAPEAIYTAHYGADTHLSGDATKLPLSRGVRLEKAMDEHSLVVWEMNGEPLPAIHGGPVRLLFPGWPGSASHKWLNRIELRDVEHDGPGMTGTSYRVAIKPMIPGSEADDSNFRILESMPVRSIITAPANGTTLPAGTRSIAIRGAAWNGDHGVAAVHVSIDFGATWQEVNLQEQRNRYDWRRWTAALPLPEDGYYELWSRATDETGVMQPHIAGNWNPSGYGGNPMHRVAVLIA
jgi:DMSO/TMAO reductase YedYZ molybdopterin-dependent catalytic subunit